MPRTLDRPRREVVSFVRRSARLNPSQARALERHQNMVIEVPTGELSTSVAPDATVDWAGVFGRSAPLIVEIGGGSGQAIAAHAAARPDLDHVGFEVHLPSAASTVSRLARAGLSNARVVPANGVQALERLFGPESVTELWTFFPDPWPKARHHKRRLVTRDFADLVSSRLVPGGVWRLATDWADYAEAIVELLGDHEALTGGEEPRWPGRPQTKFETRGIAADRQIIDLAYRRPE